MKSSASYLAIAVVAFSGSAVSAQGLGEFYAGAYGSAMSFSLYDGIGFNPEGNETLVGAVFGWRHPANDFFYGVEGDFGVSLDPDFVNALSDGCPTFSGICAYYGDARLRVIGGYSYNNMDFFAGVGAVHAIMAEGNDSRFGVTGLTYGVGVDYKLTNGLTLRLEGLNDDFGDFVTPDGKAANWNSTTIRAAAMYRF